MVSVSFRYSSSPFPLLFFLPTSYRRSFAFDVLISDCGILSPNIEYAWIWNVTWITFIWLAAGKPSLQRSDMCNSFFWASNVESPLWRFHCYRSQVSRLSNSSWLSFDASLLFTVLVFRILFCPSRLFYHWRMLRTSYASRNSYGCRQLCNKVGDYSYHHTSLACCRATVSRWVDRWNRGREWEIPLPEKATAGLH